MRFKEFWDKEAENYRKNQWEKGGVAKFDYLQTKIKLLKFLNPSSKDSILEIGCGGGTWTKIVSKKCKRLVALDISECMIKKAKKYVVSKKVKFIRNDFMKQNFKEKFDKLFTVRAIEYFGDKSRFIKKSYGLLKPFGKIVIITKSKSCLWDIIYKMRWKKTKFTQKKINAISLMRILTKNGFIDIGIQPAIIRLPIFASGNEELPLIPRKHEKYFLKLFSFVLKITNNLPRELLLLLAFISESYVVFATKK